MEIKPAIQPAARMLFITALCLSMAPVLAQHARTQADDISRVVDAWNSALNARDPRALERIYDNTVILGNKPVTRAMCIAAKKRVFNASPDFSQTVTGLTYSKQARDVVQCSFDMRMVKNGTVWKYPAYVLVALKDDQYRVVGESEDNTGTTLALYKKMSRDAQASARASAKSKKKAIPRMTSRPADSAVAQKRTPEMVRSEPQQDTLSGKTTDARSGRNRASLPAVATEPLSIPLHYVYTVGGTLVVLAVFILIAGMGSKKRRQQRADRAARATETYDQVQSAQFEKFVITLFDPKYFRIFRGRPERVLRQGNAEVVDTAELELEFRHNETNAAFFVSCQYLPALKHRLINIFPRNRQAVNTGESIDNPNQYTILGIEGKPDDPKEMYLIPLNEISQPLMTYPELQRYRKYGMFFYNAMAGRLQ